MTFLWRAAGSPDTGFSGSYYFDVSADDYFCKAATWATEYGIITIEGVYFQPNTPCTRAAAVEYIWHYAKSPSAAEVSFSDVKAGTETAKAVSWAVGYGVTNGTSSTTFSPSSTCTRGQIVTFLHRYFVEPLETTPAPAPTPAPVDPLELDPLPPEDYMKQPDWYMSLTLVQYMSDERLLAESQQIGNVMKDFRNRDIYIGDAIYARELDLWAEIVRRGLNQ